MHHGVRATARTNSVHTRVTRGLAAGLGLLLATGSLLGAALPAAADDAIDAVGPIIEIQPPVEESGVQPLATTEEPVIAVQPVLTPEPRPGLGGAEAVVDGSHPDTNFELDKPSAWAGGEPIHVMIRLVDADGTPVRGHAQELSLTSMPVGVQPHPIVEDSNSPGVYHTVVTAHTPGIYELRIAWQQSTAIKAKNPWDERVEFRSTLDLDRSDLEITPGRLPVTEQHVLTVRLRDYTGNPMQGMAGALYASATDGVKVSRFEEDWDGDGTFYRALLSSEKAVTAKVDVYVEGKRLREPLTAAWDVTVDVLQSHTETIGWTKPLGTAHTLIVRLNDTRGEFVPGRGDGLLVEQLDGQLGGPSKIVVGEFSEQDIDDEPVYVAQISSSAVGQYMVRVSFEGQTIYGSPFPMWWHTSPVSAHNSTLTVSKDSAQADGADQVDVEVLLFDENGAPVTELADVHIHTTLGTVTGTQIVRMGGRFLATLSSDVEGTAVVSFTVDDVPGVQTATVTFHPVPTAGEDGDASGAGAGIDTAVVTTDAAGSVARTGMESIAWPAGVIAAAIAALGAILLVTRRRVADEG